MHSQIDPAKSSSAKHFSYFIKLVCGFKRLAQLVETNSYKLSQFLFSCQGVSFLLLLLLLLSALFNISMATDVSILRHALEVVILMVDEVLLLHNDRSLLKKMNHIKLTSFGALHGWTTLGVGSMFILGDWL